MISVPSLTDDQARAKFPGSWKTLKPYLRIVRDASGEPNIKSGAEQIDPGDVGKAHDLAGAIAFLASGDAHFVTGTALNVDGGRLGSFELHRGCKSPLTFLRQQGL